MQEGVPSCSSGTAQEKYLQENSDPGKLWTAEGIGPQSAGGYSTVKVAPRRGHDRKRYGQDSVIQETRKGRTFGKRRWKGPECNSVISLRQQLRGSKRIKDLGGRRLLCLRKERTTTNGVGEWSSGQRSHLGSGGTQ
ncbi:hypothetical protein B7P43_G04804 [Cryptotermes secundus]|uniref:Uncharacterized protein n=1 Tax=Cryptotermes secundus TaxID=105785 RepID=A0A2J7R366_9NEOP|nr:hypothetical protein B7P43_G04804 [Cryptotermes secundus]